MQTRREFMVSGSIVSALTVARVLPGSQIGAKPPTIGLGFSLYGMKSLAVTKAIGVCADIGYDCIELPVQDGWPADSLDLSEAPEKIRDQLASSNVRLFALMENLHAAVDDQRHQSNLLRLQAAGKLGHQLSPEKPPVIETILGGRPADWDKIKMQMAKRLQDWAKVAMATRTVIAIKAHVGGAMHLPEHPVWLMNRVNSPWIKCAYDYSHFELRDVDMAASVKTLVPHSVFIHVKDSRGDASNVQFMLPGDGDIDYVQLLKLITNSGYRGDILVEVSGQIHSKPGYDPLVAAKHCYTNLAPAFEKAGILRG
jgi:sugar phosphate isomerase/epimerase